MAKPRLFKTHKNYNQMGVFFKFGSCHEKWKFENEETQLGLVYIAITKKAISP